MTTEPQGTLEQKDGLLRHFVLTFSRLRGCVISPKGIFSLWQGYYELSKGEWTWPW